MQSDTFDEVLGLEEQFYGDGFAQGLADGVKAGQVEGRTFGLEKGFEKYLESGRLYGKSLIWANRIPRLQDTIANEKTQDAGLATDNASKDLKEKRNLDNALPPLLQHERLSKHLKVLYALSESESLSTENTEEAVSDFDDRLKRAQGKAKIIERIVGEGKEEDSSGQTSIGNASRI
ncbi:DUF1715-domain-containing protein [Stipitochalara longipes BDJ]|nr:DUF1715-domain-containing protein [Stipitochalara longipes BDJ]